MKDSLEDAIVEILREWWRRNDRPLFRAWLWLMAGMWFAMLVIWLWNFLTA